MRRAGVVQRGADVLRQPARTLDLPREESLASEVIARLFAALGRIEELHRFGKGLGLAAPQLGLGHAVAVVRPAGRPEASIVLLNPRVVDVSPESDERYEGCLSFFDVRGLVRRPLWMELQSSALDGSRAVTRFERGTARLVAHEVDHLYGQLYVDRMAPGAPLVPVEEYQATGQPWQY
jgi:peptide deformylase